MKKLRSIRSNIYWDYSFSFFSFFNLTHGLWMIYLAGFKHFSLLQLGLLEGIFHLTSFLMEVPTGAVADIWGKRISRIAGRYLFIISLIILFFADSFLLQALGFVLCALNYNLESGSGDALVYDSVLLLKEEKRYMFIKGKKEFLYQLSSILAFLLGGYLAVRSYPLVFLVTALFSVLSLVNAYFFTEPVFATTGERRSRPIQIRKKKLSASAPSSLHLL